MVDKWQNQCEPGNVDATVAGRHCRNCSFVLPRRQSNLNGTIWKWAVFQCLGICLPASPKLEQLRIHGCWVGTWQRSKHVPCIANCRNWLHLWTPPGRQSSTIDKQVFFNEKKNEKRIQITHCSPSGHCPRWQWTFSSLSMAIGLKQRRYTVYIEENLETSEWTNVQTTYRVGNCILALGVSVEGRRLNQCRIRRGASDLFGDADESVWIWIRAENEFGNGYRSVCWAWTNIYCRIYKSWKFKTSAIPHWCFTK